MQNNRREGAMANENQTSSNGETNPEPPKRSGWFDEMYRINRGHSTGERDSPFSNKTAGDEQQNTDS